MACDESLRVVPIQASNAASVLGINDKLQLAEAERIYQRAQADDLMRAGATLADPNRIDVRGSVTVGQDVYIDINAVFTGKVELGDGVWIGPNCVISDTRLGAGCVVHANMVMQGVVAGPHCELGPFARLRPGTELAARVKVGNFVETKNSKVAPGSKINHLSYIGDAELGSDVNVGAGTITCNYDGANKFKTVLGEDVFIGSNSALVAPVTLGDRATTGAGSVITSDVPTNTLAVGRAKQRNIEGWKRPIKK
jgi:bifunctional UDP-N-acetylglucosamine pyrophosphorylase/glucosamine-1-phosphate N-acetyltransferase